MGLLQSLFGPSNDRREYTIEITSSIMPEAAVDAIFSARLPHLKTDRLFMKKGEVIHYIDKAIQMKPNVKKIYSRMGAGFNIWGVTIARGFIEPEEYPYWDQIMGILYITNKRTVFEAKSNGFDKPHTTLTSTISYSNAVNLQFGSTHYCIVIPDGNLAEKLYSRLRTNS